MTAYKVQIVYSTIGPPLWGVWERRGIIFRRWSYIGCFHEKHEAQKFVAESLAPSVFTSEDAA